MSTPHQSHKDAGNCVALPHLVQYVARPKRHTATDIDHGWRARLDSGFCGKRFHRLNLLVAIAGQKVVVEHPAGLHEGVANRRTNKFKTAFLQRLAHVVGFGRC